MGNSDLDMENEFDVINEIPLLALDNNTNYELRT